MYFYIIQTIHPWDSLPLSVLIWLEYFSVRLRWRRRRRYQVLGPQDWDNYYAWLPSALRLSYTASDQQHGLWSMESLIIWILKLTTAFNKISNRGRRKIFLLKLSQNLMIILGWCWKSEPWSVLSSLDWFLELDRFLKNLFLFLNLFWKFERSYAQFYQPFLVNFKPYSNFDSQFYKGEFSCPKRFRERFSS